MARVLGGAEVILNEEIAGQPPELEVEFPGACARGGRGNPPLAVTGGDGHEIRCGPGRNDGGATWMAVPVLPKHTRWSSTNIYSAPVLTASWR